MTTTRAGLSAALPIFIVLGLLIAAAPDTAADDQIQEIARHLDAGSVEQNWDLVARLERLGPDKAPLIEEALPGAGEKARLGLAQALIGLGRKDAGMEVIQDLILEARDVEVRRSAARILESRGEPSEIRKVGKKLDGISDPFVKISLAKALARDDSPRERRRGTGILKEFLDVDDFSLRCEAAIALAEIGDFDSGRRILSRIQYEPSLRGRLARRLIDDEHLLDAEQRVGGLERDELVNMQNIRIEELEKQIEKLKNRGYTDPLIEELILKIQTFHVDGDITPEQLIDAAAHGMVSGMVIDPPLDQFSSYMNEKETRKFREGLKGIYAGIGAVVSMDLETKFLTVVKPIYSGPAYRAGLRMNDVVLQVDGRSTYNEKVEDMVRIIRGTPDTPVTLLVNRRGWPEPKSIEIIRKFVELPIVQGEVLPGKVGYLRLLQFGQLAGKRMSDELDRLEDLGMASLVLDLRGNPGGLLDQAVEVVGMFLNQRKVIVTSRGRNLDAAPETPYEGGGEKTRPDYPMVVLVDGRSASASEIVAGALQDFDRATLVGKKTFGKGSVQRPMDLDATPGLDMLKLTVAEYFLPSGRSIHEKGVVPDIVIESGWTREISNKEWARLVEQKAFKNYVEENFPGNEKLFAELAENDGKDSSRYPGFKEWYRSLETTLIEEDIRWILRREVRDRVEDEQGSEFAMNLQDDIQLQRAVVEALTRLGESYKAIEEYSFFPEEFPEVHPEEEPRRETR